MPRSPERDRFAPEVGDGLNVLGREDPVAAARIVEREHARQRFFVRLRERHGIRHGADGIDLAGEKAPKAAA